MSICTCSYCSASLSVCRISLCSLWGVKKSRMYTKVATCPRLQVQSVNSKSEPSCRASGQQKDRYHAELLKPHQESTHHARVCNAASPGNAPRAAPRRNPCLRGGTLAALLPRPVDSSYTFTGRGERRGAERRCRPSPGHRRWDGLGLLRCRLPPP